MWIQACAQPVRTRWGVMTHQARAVIRWRDGGHDSAAAMTVIAAAAAVMSHPGPRVTPMPIVPSSTPAIRPSS